MLRNILKSTIFAAMLTACGNVNYETTKAATFSGSLFVMWVGENQGSGDGKFVFVPNPRNPLTLTRNVSNGTVQTITPGMMYTDGGSIPRVAQIFNGFSPWGYAPAYMVHDWLFVAKHCLNDGFPDETHLEFSEMQLQESAEIIAEAIKGLIESKKVQDNDVAPRIIAGAVAGPLAYERWVAKGDCLDERVSEDHKAEALAGIPGGRKSRLRGLSRTEESGEIVPLQAGTIVGVINF